MTEDFLHFIWKYGLFDPNGLITDTGDTVQVISMGEHNTNAGPDFLNARVKIGTTTWAGNVEIHIRSSDWLSHRHHTDRAYDNVILHVVYLHDQVIKRPTGEIVPTAELHFNNTLFENYSRLLGHKDWLPCRDKIMQVDTFLFELWLNSLVVERLQQKAHYISVLLDQYRNSWEEAFYIGLARSFGFGLNAIPFEMMAKSVSLMQLARSRDSVFQVEALLMGQAGFLDDPALYAGYYSSLRKEYLHFRRKYGLKPIGGHLWKFLRLRPVNFPTVRIAQFAAVLVRAGGLFSRVLECNEISELQQLFTVQASEFWDSHYTFETVSPVKTKKLGTDAFQTIVINAVVPFVFVYGQRTGAEERKERALEWLNQLPPEKNRLVSRWSNTGIIPASAFYSQGILQMANSYCGRKRCLACSVGTSIITSGI
ncbi:MAG TPA: DUF2851 family protein [Bacteroidales bacterium]|nr:DUF2851 family protein [Bacteroidales bacterium]